VWSRLLLPPKTKLPAVYLDQSLASGAKSLHGSLDEPRR
jgi:hypothetical protein